MERILIEKHSDVVPELKKLREKGIIKGDTVCLRHFRSSRLNELLDTGTDRDNESIVHDNLVGFFSDGGFKRPDEITYARTVNLTTDPPLSVPLRRESSELVDNMDYLEKLSPDFNQVIYDPENLFRVSENEYWFQSSPKRAIVAVFEIID